MKNYIAALFLLLAAIPAALAYPALTFQHDFEQTYTPVAGTSSFPLDQTGTPNSFTLDRATGTYALEGPAYGVYSSFSDFTPNGATMAAWFKWDGSFPQTASILSLGNSVDGTNMSLYLTERTATGFNKLCMEAFDGAGDSHSLSCVNVSSVNLLGEYHHFAGTFSGGQISTFYVDDVVNSDVTDFVNDGNGYSNSLFFDTAAVGTFWNDTSASGVAGYKFDDVYYWAWARQQTDIDAVYALYSPYTAPPQNNSVTPPALGGGGRIVKSTPALVTGNVVVTPAAQTSAPVELTLWEQIVAWVKGLFA